MVYKSAIERWLQRWISNISIRGSVFIRKISDFKTICFKKNQKILRCNSKWKLENMVKRKTDKDEIGNILFKTRFYQFITQCCPLDPHMGCANVSLKYKLNCCLSFPKWMLIAGIRILLSLNIAFTDVSSRYVTLSRYHFKWKYPNLKIHHRTKHMLYWSYITVNTFTDYYHNNTWQYHDSWYNNHIVLRIDNMSMNLLFVGWT